MSVFHDRTIPDGNVHLVKTGKYDASEQPGRYHFSIPWIGAGLAVFMFCGFVKSIPIEIEEAAMIDGCTPIQTFFQVVFPIMKPTAITVANFTGNVDLERLFTSLSGIGYQKIQDDSNRHSVLKRWLWSSRLGYDDGNACTCDRSNCSFLCGLSEIYY